jgi:hypothetical protein
LVLLSENVLSNDLLQVAIIINEIKGEERRAATGSRIVNSNIGGKRAIERHREIREMPFSY